MSTPDDTAAAAAPVWLRTMVTGHRPQHLSAEQVAWSQVTLATTAGHLARSYGTRHAITGLALGADTWWAMGALGAGLQLHSYIPFLDQAAKWTSEQRALWAALRAASTTERVIGTQAYDVRMLHARNDAMLTDADLVVALLRSDSTSGGTHSTVTKARRARRPLLIIDPVHRTLTREHWDPTS